MKKRIVYVSAVLIVVGYVTAGQAEVFYSNDFENSSDPLAEWSSDSIENSPDGRSFLGHFSGNDMVSLTLDSLPSHSSLTVAFDLYVINTWDGHGDEWGPDEWELGVQGGPVLLHTTFTNANSGSKRQAYPDWYPGGDYAAKTGAVESTQFGYDTLYTAHVPLAGAVYKMSFTFAHNSDSVQLNFRGFNLEDRWWDYWLTEHTLMNESWGLDNVIVTPEPSALLLLGLGSLALRRKRKAKEV